MGNQLCPCTCNIYPDKKDNNDETDMVRMN